MKPNLITMLTYNDTTVGNAKDLYQQCSDLPVLHWGFKDVGLPRAKMVELVEAMQRDGKVTYLEVVSLSEKECMAGAEIAVACDFDCLMGTVFFDSVGEFLREHETDYFPFCGKVQGHPSVLSGSVDEIVDVIHMLWVDDSLCSSLKKKGLKKANEWGQNEFNERLLHIIQVVLK